MAAQRRVAISAAGPGRARPAIFWDEKRKWRGKTMRKDKEGIMWDIEVCVVEVAKEFSGFEGWTT